MQGARAGVISVTALAITLALRQRSHKRLTLRSRSEGGPIRRSFPTAVRWGCFRQPQFIRHARPPWRTPRNPHARRLSRTVL